MVTYGDSFLPVDFGDIQQAFLSNSDPAFMTVYKNTDRRHSNNVDFKLGKVLAYDKEGGGYDYLDFGLIFMQASVFLNSPWGTNFDLGVALRDLAKSHRLSGIEVKQSFYEIGSFHGIEKFARYIERLNRDI
jgi:NDP-sugar pyrophosphorylase family protein